MLVAQRKPGKPPSSLVRRPALSHKSFKNRETSSTNLRLVSSPSDLRPGVKEPGVLTRAVTGPSHVSAPGSTQPAGAPLDVDRLLAIMAGQSGGSESSGGVSRSPNMPLPIWPALGRPAIPSRGVDATAPR